VAESDLWKVVREVLKEREKSEFDRALRTVDESLAMLRSASSEPAEMVLSTFYQERMEAMKRFFNSLDNLVAMLTALEELRTGSMQSLFKRAKGN